MQKSRVYKVLTWIVVCAQLLMVAGTATVGVVQPTPQMAEAVAQNVGLGSWWSTLAGQMTAALQPLWGEPGTARASAIRDVGPMTYNQWLTTVHPEENLVVNGSFEMGPQALNAVNLPGWTVASGKVDLWNGYFNPDGSTSEIDLAGTPGPGVLEQTITGLVAGQSYFFEFSYSANTFANEQAKAQILDGATPLIDQTVTALGHPYSYGWQSFRQSFTAPASGTVKIRFQDLSVDPHIYHGVIIDDVRVAKRLINYVLNGSFEAGPHGLNTTIIPNWTVESGRVDIHAAYFHPDRSRSELDLAGSPGPGIARQTVSGLTAGQSYIFEFDYTVNAFANEQARVQVLDGSTPLINQTVTTNGDGNQKGWKHFRQSFTAPASGSVTLRFQDLSTDVFTNHGILVDNVRVADEPLNYVINGDFENAPYALNIANDAIPGWTVTSGPVDIWNPGLLYEKMVDLNGSPGNGKIEQSVTGLTAGQLYAFQFNYQNHTSFTTWAYTRLLDSTNAKLYEKRISCKGHVVHEGWCTLRYFFTAPANGQIKIVFENDEADGNPYYGVNIDNVSISRDLNYIVNGNFSSGPIGLNQNNVPGWSVAGPTDTHDGFGGEYRFTVDLNGSPGDGKLRQVIKGLAPGQSYTLRYNYASTAHNYLVNFDVKVTDSTGTNVLLNVAQSTNQLPYVGGWKQAEHTFTAPADGVVQVNFNNNETDNNPYYAALIDNIQLWGQAATAGTEVNVCNGTIVIPRPPATTGPGGVTNGLAFWVRADQDVFSDGGATAAVEGDGVQQWNDQSGVGLDLTQTTAGQKPTYRAGVARGNFNPTLEFSDDFIRNTSRVVQTTDDLTFIAVGDTDVTGGVRTLMGMGDNYNDPTIDLDGTWISPWYDGGGTVDLFTTETLPTNQAMIWGMRGTNGNTNGMRFNYSGEEVAMNMTVANQPNYGQNVGIGSDGGGEDWDGRIPEALIYERNLSSAEMDKVYSYLALKYGITLRLSTVSGSRAPGNYVSSKGALVWNYDGNSNYHYDVAGIVRDDASDLLQKQSNSVNSDNLITIGLGGIAATNAENINNFDADQSFLLWGNNNAATTIATSVSVSLTRMARVWTVQETTPITAPIGLVTVRVPQSAFSLGAGQVAFFLRSVDPVFTNADTVQFMTCDGTNCTTEINFADGDYFTLARASVSPEITVGPTSHNFGTLGTTETSPVRNVTISNVGNAPLNLTSIQMTNSGSGQFVNTNSCGATLNPGANCVAGVTFTPNANGAQSGVLTIASNDSDEASTVVNLSGTGVVQAPDITVLPTALTFGDTLVNSTALAQRVVITNVGTGNLAVQNLTLAGANSDQFVIVSPDSSCTPLTKDLAGGASCDVEVLFSPTSVGAKSASLIIASNDTDEITTTVTLNGVGVACSGALNAITLMADYLEMIDQDNKAAACVMIAGLPNLTIGKSGPANATQGTNFAYTLVITNTGTAATSGVITVTDTLAAGLSFVSGSGGGFTCAASGQNVTCTSSTAIATGNSTATITLNVNPTTPGVKNNTASVVGGGDSSATNSNTVNTTVAGAPDLTTTIGQPSPAFVAGVVSSVPLTVSNIGTGPTTGPITATMTLPANTSTPTSFTSGVWSCATSGQTVTCTQPGPIAAGGSSTVQVSVTPNVSTVGTQPVFNGTTGTTGETNTGNNAASPMTPSVAVAAPPPVTVTVDKKFSSDNGVTFSDAITVAQGTTLIERIYYNNTSSSAGLTATVQATLPAGFTLVAGSTKNCLNPAAGETVCNTDAGQGGAINEGAVWSGQTLMIAPSAGLYGVATSATSGLLETGKKRYLSYLVCNLDNVVNGSGNGTYGHRPYAFSNDPNYQPPTNICPAAFGSNSYTYFGKKTIDMLGKRYLTAFACNIGNVIEGSGNGIYGYSSDLASNNASYSAAGSLCPPNFGSTASLVSSRTIDLERQRYLGVLVCNIGNVVNGSGNGVTGYGATIGTNDAGYSATTATCQLAYGSTATYIESKVLDSLDTTRGTGYIEFKMVANSAGAYTQNASLSGSNFTTQNDSGNIRVNGIPDLVTSIGQPSPNFVTGAASNVPMTVTNTGTGPTTGPITATMTLPANTSAPASFTSGSWSCTTVGQVVTCTQAGPINAGSSSTIQLPVTPSAGAVGTQPGPFTGGVTTPGDSNSGNNAATPMTPTTPVAGVPDLTTTIGQPSPAFVAGAASNVPMTVTNVGNGPTTGPITASMTLPANTSAPASFTSGSWNCTTAGQTITCTSNGVIPAGGSSTIQLPVTPSAGAVGTQPGPFTGSASGGGDTNSGNNGATPMTPTTPVAAAPTSSITLPTLKLFLGGAYDATSGMMRDDLRSKNLLPTSSPYGSAPATANASVFSVTGNDAIVDWVLVEVRNAVTPATISASKAAFVQRDGDVVALDGTSALTISVGSGNYYVAVQHRNHLGVMTAAPVALSTTTPAIDFTTSAGYGTNGQAMVGGVNTLWMGNTSGDNRIIGAGPSNDRNPILSEALAAPGNTNHNANYIVTAYSAGDVNLDGRVIAAGPGNDINFILYVVFSHPGNGSAAANYVVQGQLP